MNGTQGIVLDILDVQNEKGEFKPSYLIQWDDRSEQMHMAIGDKISENIILAYACTIHKVQGSQYPCVIAICHSIHAYMLSRNLLYTAVTRARKSAIIIGNNKGLRKAITTTTPMDRRTLTLARCNLDIEIEQEDLNGSTKESN
jgi:exodeoxyribonuclease V alpha subunit